LKFKSRKATSKSISTNQVLLVLVAAFLLFGTSIGIAAQQFVNNGAKQFGITATTTTGQLSSSAGGAQGVSCSNTQGWQVQQKPLAYGSDTLAGTAAENAYVASTGAGAPDLTGTTTFTSAGTYPLNGQYLIQASETSTVTTYPVNYLLTASASVPSSGTSIATMGPGLTVAQILCTPSSSNSNRTSGRT